jgi:hypothetical protein
LVCGAYNSDRIPFGRAADVEATPVPLDDCIVALASVIGGALVIGWLWLRTESIWMVALAHRALNNWGQYAFKFMDDGGAGGQPRDMLVLAAGGLALVAVGSLPLAIGRASERALGTARAAPGGSRGLIRHSSAQVCVAENTREED